MKFAVIITLKKDVLDPQGKVIEQTLQGMGKTSLKSLRQGKYIEIELSEMDEEESREFQEEMGLQQTGLDQVILRGYELLNQITYFTAGAPEVRAWEIQNGTHASSAAGKIHTDFEKGFIRAEVYNYSDLIQLGSENAVKEAGKLRLEGREYMVQDGDIMHFRFNV